MPLLGAVVQLPHSQTQCQTHSPGLLLTHSQGEKKLNTKPGFFGGLLGSSGAHYEDAADFFTQAANQYKLRKQGKNAGQAFEKAAQAQIKADYKDEAANTLVDAFKAYRQEDPASAARCLEQAIDFFTARGQFRRAANFKMDLGGLYEEELMDLPKAVQSYQDAGDWFESDSAQALSNKAFLKCADLTALEGNYSAAAATYKKVVAASASNNLSRWSLKDYFVKVVLCYLAGDDRVAAMNYLQEAQGIDQSFTTTKEYKLLQDVTEAVNDGDSEKLANSVFEFDQFSKLDKWKTTMLLKIKTSITEAEDDLL
ncbi:CYFA0S01e12794g1_1 [Cyberlindnera fabianii]|uniref:CYFA0S01e12794g1_1 n=1 Tax=Cyberlindnera fabianii TaxID=36022 RepID=A0A061AS86_CYBFA|nr:CYFA0S01e12794g1_1 [Cyberlindnera fabianii]